MSVVWYEELAETIVEHSLALKSGEHVWIDVVGESEPLVLSLISSIYDAGAYPHVTEVRLPVLKRWLNACSPEQVQLKAEHDRSMMRQMQAYIGIRADDNIFELEDVPAVRHATYRNEYRMPLQAEMAGLERWVLLKAPTHGMAQLANMSFQALCDTFHRSCSMDYNRFNQYANRLGKRLAATKRVRIVSPHTDLHFSIEGISHYVCDGRFNLPDGEIFTAPVKDSVEGVITFNVPTMYMGKNLDRICLHFREGRVVRYESTNDMFAKEILDTDEGARYVGEFGMGLNPYIRKPFYHLMFDEKMSGSIHLALGQAYPMADNGNVSAVHLDFVLNQRQEYGGGQIYFDEKLVRLNGRFIDDELVPLNDDQPGWG